ncbi:calexcitin-1 [Bacillus rossius redtenbacheri]|uniref:calexcitin-1 n=1 Tax=Bacillus rossius redtenbacheri TaxID=93214 RepID=UPI002FDEABD2
MPISEFRKKKLLFVFKVFFDVNQSGTIDQKDFELAVDNICRMRGWAQGDANYQKTRNTLLKIWDGLKTCADSDKDGQISHDEWCTMWDDYSKKPDSALEWQQVYMNFMFDLEDASGDGSIDEDEFTLVCSSYGLSKDECGKAFKKFSSNGSVEVTRKVFADLWREYFSTDNPNAPGNFIFGKVNFD